MAHGIAHVFLKQWCASGGKLGVAGLLLLTLGGLSSLTPYVDSA